MSQGSSRITGPFHRTRRDIDGDVHVNRSRNRRTCGSHRRGDYRFDLSRTSYLNASFAKGARNRRLIDVLEGARTIAGCGRPPAQDDDRKLHTLRNREACERCEKSGPSGDERDTYFPGDVKTRFSDVWGQDSVLARVKENIIYLKDPDSIEKRGGYVPGGILLWGPPGTGKTLIAEAVYSRCVSALKDERVKAARKLKGPRPTLTSIAANAEKKKQFIADIRDALYCSKIVSYAQGYHIGRPGPHGRGAPRAVRRAR